MKSPWIQISIDTQDIESGMEHLSHALAIDAEWIEVGTPLLTFEGIESIGTIAKAAKGRTVVADFKAMDGVAQYFVRAGELGAKVATVMALTTESSIQEAIRAGHESGVEIQVDMLNIPRAELAEKAKKITDMGADYFLLHLSIDELVKRPDSDPLAGLDELLESTDLPVGTVTFNAEQGVEAVKRGASYLVIGYPLITMADAEEQLDTFARLVRSVR